MSGSKKISELTTATALAGDEIFPIVQQGETRQATISVLSALAPVQSVNGLTGIVMLALGDLTGVEPIVSAQGVSAAIAAVSLLVSNVSVLVSANTVQINAVSALTSVNLVQINTVSALVSVNSLAITSVQNYLLSQISAATSGGIADAPGDGQIYGRTLGSWVPVSVTAIAMQVNAVSALVSTALGPRPYNVVFDFGASTVPMGEYPKVTPAGLTFYVLPSCSGSQVVFNTSAFPATIVSIPIMYPTSATLGILEIGVSGTATWPAIVTTSIAPGQTFGVQTSVSADPTLAGLVISFAGWYRP